ncbi:MAG: hypothetical protein HFH35_13310 [Eubacterium sp.]|nr:hypothetical protein [Eubacterium sp.]
MRAERDIALCAVADAQVKSKVMNLMIQKRIPYAEEWHKVPLFKRRKFEGAREVCVVVTHHEKAAEAKKQIEELEESIRSRVFFDLDGIV